MKATGWSNGRPTQTGSGYGLKLSADDRNQHFRRGWSFVTIRIGDELLTVPLSDGFWHDCIELRSRDIGEYLLRRGLAPWPKRRPPTLELVPEGGAIFRLE
jgi:hypothetical protein